MKHSETVDVSILGILQSKILETITVGELLTQVKELYPKVPEDQIGKQIVALRLEELIDADYTSLGDFIEGARAMVVSINAKGLTVLRSTRGNRAIVDMLDHIAVSMPSSDSN